MDLRQLRYFVAVAQARNFSRAAELLHMAQPPLSRQIQQLEAGLGVALLIRGSRPLRLTDAGRMFYEEARQVLARVEQMQDAARRIGRSERKTLSVGFVASTLYGDLPEVLRHLRQSHPELDIRLVEMMSGEQVEALKDGRIDIGFGRIRSRDPAVERLVLREERLVLAMPTDHPLAVSSAPLAPNALAGKRLIVYPSRPRPSFADHVLSLLADHGAHPSEVQEVLELQTALGLVASQAGLCMVPASARTIRPDLHYRLIDDERATSPVILSHRRNDATGAVDAIMEAVRTTYSQASIWLDGIYNKIYIP